MNKMKNMTPQQKRKGIWTNDVENAAVTLIEYTFAIWTLQHSKEYFMAGKDKLYLMQPKVAQIVSILRILSIDVSGNELKRHLVEIGTGEGKSLTFAVTSAILALLGYDVSCACYSKYLSDRDYKAFENLFKSLGLTDFIHYGTFSKVCEAIINENGYVRQQVSKIVLGHNVNNNNNNGNINDDDSDVSETVKTVAMNPDEFEADDDGKDDEKKMNYDDDYRKKPKSNNRAKILLIDEVDVFFHTNFYGNDYTPSATIKAPCIKKITDLI